MSTPTVTVAITPEAEAMLAELADAPDFLTPADAAEKLHVQPNTIRRMVREGELAHLPITRSGRIRIPRSELVRIATTVRIVPDATDSD
jgi:excisionase family DNA binding protein